MAKPDEYNWGSSNTADTAYFRTAGSPMSAALLSNGYAGADIPDNQDHNTLFRNAYLWQQYQLSRAESTEDTLLYSSGTATWNGSTLTLSANLDFKFRKSTGQQVNRIAAGALAFTDGHVLVLRRDKASASPVTLALAGSYGTLATGEYVIVAETSLTEDNEEYETVIFRRNGTTLECPSLGLIYSSGAVITFGNFVDVAANYTWTGSHTFSALSTHSLGVTIPTTKKLSLNVGATSFIYEQSASDVRIAANNTDGLRVTATLVEAMSGRDFIVQSGQKNYLDGGGDTYLYESAANVVRLYVGGINAWTQSTGAFNPLTDVYVEATKKVFLDGGSDTYIHESAANRIDFYTGGAIAASLKDNEGILLPDLDPPTANYMSRNSGAKAWLRYTDNSGVVTNSYNIVSVTDDDGDGRYTITFDTDFSTAYYSFSGSSGGGYFWGEDAVTGVATAGVLNIIIQDYNGVATDNDFTLTAHGKQ